MYGGNVMEFKCYDAKERAKRFKESMRAGYLSKSDLSTVVYLSEVPEYAKEEVIRLALKD